MRLSPKSRSPKKAIPGIAPSQSAELNLLVNWSNPLEVFTNNLFDRLHGRVVPVLATSSPPDHHFWHDVDLRTPFPSRGLFNSVLAHCALLGVLCAISIWPQSTAHIADSFDRQPGDSSTFSQYLPELHGAPTDPPKRSNVRKTHSSVAATQEIRSLPKSPDNLHQTVVTPPKLTLEQDVNLPNLVAYEPAAPVQPLDASKRQSARMKLPALLPEVIAPATDTTGLHANKKLPSFQQLVVEPAPEIAQASPRLSLPSFQPKVVDPAPDLSPLSRGTSTNLAHLVPRVIEPVPESPHLPDTPHPSAQIIALNLHPAHVNAPVRIPSGNRSGAFATSPDGHDEINGVPGDTPAATNAELQRAFNAPPGITANAAPLPAAPAAAPNASSKVSGDSIEREKMMATIRPAAIKPIPSGQPIAHESSEPRSALENRIFAGRRSYTLQVNMPNLNTVTGSWIIHFAEQAAGTLKAPIAAPEVLSKSDPAYPGDLIDDGVHGTVILTAIIRADGSVAEVSVAKSLDPRLDRNAVEAFSRWLFRPALKDGHPIDLQAVITVPFRAKTPGF